MKQRASNRSAYLSWPFSKRPVDPVQQAKAVQIYRRLFTQPRKLATLRAEFDAAVHEGSENGTTPELVDLLKGHAAQITRLMTTHWNTVVNRSEQWPRLRTRRGEELASNLRELFIEYVEKTIHWLDYFVMDPSWLNLTAVNYAANAAREAASEVRQVRIKFEKEYELTRDHLAAKPVTTAQPPNNEAPTGKATAEPRKPGSEQDAA